jgi:hypothetical protein
MNDKLPLKNAKKIELYKLAYGVFKDKITIVETELCRGTRDYVSKLFLNCQDCGYEFGHFFVFLNKNFKVEFCIKSMMSQAVHFSRFCESMLLFDFYFERNNHKCEVYDFVSKLPRFLF